MKIILDECLPKRLRKFFAETNVWTVPQIGFAGYKDRDLLDELDKLNIDLFITVDGNIEYQQQFSNRSFGTIIIRSVSNRYEDLKLFQNQIISVAETIKAGQIVRIP